jgi:hypothetical protein
MLVIRVPPESAAGKSEIMIMDRTGHKSIATVKRYLKSTNLFALDPLAGVV